ncbi:MAG: MFS transporter [Vulcanimicrobiaceae bacterium]
MSVTQPLLPSLGAEFGVSPAGAGATISAVVFAIAVTSSAYGPVADFLGRKRVMAGGCALLGLATLACAFAPNLATLIAFRTLQGAFVPAVTAVAIAYLSQLRRKREIGGLVGLYIAATVTGGLVGRVGSGLIAERWTWRGSFVAFACLTLVAAAGLGLTLRERRAPVGRSMRTAFGDSYRAMGRHLGNPRLLGAFIVGATLFFGFIGLFTYLPYLLTSPPFSLSTGTVAWFYVSYIAGVFTAPVAGRLSMRVSRRLLIAIGFGIALLGLALTALPSLVAVALGTVVLCVGMFTAQAIVPAYVNVTATVAKGGANALYQAFYYAGAIFGSTLPGIGWERFGWPGVLGSCGASMLLGLGVMLVLCRESPVAAASSSLRATSR